jgi:hypothetical protein
MYRWIFVALIVANFLPALMAGNDGATAIGGLGDIKSMADSDDAGVRPLRLLAESSAEDASDDASQLTRALPQRREAMCFLIGPLASMAKAETFAQHLEEAEMKLDRRWREISIGSDYWVYLPQLPSVRATTRTLQELKARDIDGFIFSEGEMKGAIALGVFTDLGAAEAKKETFLSMGYDARLQKMDRLAREYWLISDNMPRPGMMDALVNSEELGEIPQKISRRDCKIVASAMQFQ